MKEQLRAEIDLIKDKGIREFVETVLDLAPPYFWERASSSTSKYHPAQSNIEPGGLINHTRSCVHFAQVFIRAYTQEPYILRNRPKDNRLLSKKQADYITAACIAHDITKYGLEPDGQRYTTKDHDKTSASFVRMVYETTAPNISKEDMLAICYPIMYHMGGNWSHKSVPYKSMVDYTITELIVHLADMASASKDVHLLTLDPIDDNFCG